MSTYFPIFVLALVFVLIAVRRIGRLRLKIWQIMTAGALAVMASDDATPHEALAAIHWEVMLFLFGVFVVGRALVASGWLHTLGWRVLERTRTADGLVFAVILAAGFASAFLMNDTLAVIGTPLVLMLAREHGLPPKMLLLALAFAVTTGSVMSPIGNPQNLLIAIAGGFDNPFVSFFAWLAVPTCLNLVVAWWWLRRLYRRDFHDRPLVHREVPMADGGLARLARISLAVLVAMIGLRLLLVLVGMPQVLPLSAIALAAAAPILLLSHRRLEMLRDIEWNTLAFFAAMFVLMDSVWRTGLVQKWLDVLPYDVASLPSVFVVGIGLSQLVSNVPLVALYLPVLEHAGAGQQALLALATASTIAGNLLILGAASNVIVIESAERHGETLNFMEFARAGIPLTIANILVYALFFALFA